jgi:hypothetical protein
MPAPQIVPSGVLVAAMMLQLWLAGFGQRRPTRDTSRPAKRFPKPAGAA